MPNLKDIRRRIKSVKNTQKITQAMRMVAAAKVKRAEARMNAAKPFAEALVGVFAEVMQGLQNADQVDLEESKYAALLDNRPIQRMGFIVFTSDRGLCGSFNAQLLRRVDERMTYYKERNIAPRIFLVGNKGIQAFKQRYPEATVFSRLGGISSKPSSSHAQNLMQSLVEAYLTGQIDGMELLSARFKSMMSFEPELFRLFPLRGEDLMMAVMAKSIETDVSDDYVMPEWLAEPSFAAVLDEILPMYLTQTLYARLLESAASELAARMAAMASATDNAKAMIQTLTLQYNKARQAAITQEIMEIVGGAEALA